MPNRKDSTNRSGRGIGIPVLGAIGGGDGFQQKIGRPKRPYLTGDMGSPTQSADSNFSSRLSRVNKGREDDAELAYHEMFPDQAPDVDPDLELEDGLLGMRTRKLPVYFAGMKRIPEGRMDRLGIGRPSLAMSLLNEGNEINESFIDDLAQAASSVADFAGSALGAARPLYKLAAKTAPQIGAALSRLPYAGAAATTIGAIPGLDVVYGSATSYYNYRQIKGNIEKLNDILSDIGVDDDFISLLSEDDAKFKQGLADVQDAYHSDKVKLHDELEKMFGNFKDIAVSLILMSDTLAGAGMANPLVAIVGSVATTSAALMTTMVTDYEGVIPSIAKFFTGLPSPVRSIVLKGLNQIDSNITYDSFLKMIKRAGEMYRAVNLKNSGNEDLYGDESLQEIRRKKRKFKKEASGVGGIAGFTGPMSDFKTPSRRNDFEKTAAKSFGGSHLEKIDESAKYIVRGRRSLIKALTD